VQNSLYAKIMEVILAIKHFHETRFRYIWLKKDYA